jgi:DNA (cytosine-5)-methyltransferase 1
MVKKNIVAIDLFCGIGGLSYGLKQSGIKIKAGIDTDESCRYAFETNCKAKFINQDILKITGDELNSLYGKDAIKVLVGCAPCQPFSSYSYKNNSQQDPRWILLNEFSRLIKEVKPVVVSMENVPTLLNFKKAPVFLNFVESLKQGGYFVWYNIVYAPDYGIPQKRKRLVLLASKKGEIKLLPSTHSAENYVSVKNAIGDLAKLKSGEISPNDFLHRASKLSAKNLKRIKQSKPGGSWKTDWDEDLKLACHKNEKGKTYVSIYGRMRWDEPSPTMTTLCTGIGNGRFGHPEQNRSITLREASIFQSFPKNYQFVRKPEDLKITQLSRHIGNAVPPKLGKIIGQSIIEHLKGYSSWLE